LLRSCYQRQGAGQDIASLIFRLGTNVTPDWIQQTIEPIGKAPLQGVILVLDTSWHMNPVIPQVAHWMARVPDNIRFSLVLATDDGAERTDGIEAARLCLTTVTYKGGIDNIPALIQAWDLAAAAQETAIVWVHGPQPELIQPTGALLPSESLGSFFSRWSGNYVEYRLVRTVATAMPLQRQNRHPRTWPLSNRETRLMNRFPGRIARFTDGNREIILRYVASPTRTLHPAAECFEAVGYRGPQSPDGEGCYDREALGLFRRER